MCCLTYTGKNETFTTVEIGTKCGKVKNKIQNHCLLWKALSIYICKKNFSTKSLHFHHCYVMNFHFATILYQFLQW